MTAASGSALSVDVISGWQPWFHTCLVLQKPSASVAEAGAPAKTCSLRCHVLHVTVLDCVCRKTYSSLSTYIVSPNEYISIVVPLDKILFPCGNGMSLRKPSPPVDRSRSNQPRKSNQHFSSFEGAVSDVSPMCHQCTVILWLTALVDALVKCLFILVGAKQPHRVKHCSETKGSKRGQRGSAFFQLCFALLRDHSCTPIITGSSSNTGIHPSPCGATIMLQSSTSS